MSEENFTVFEDQRRIAAGSLAEIGVATAAAAASFLSAIRTLPRFSSSIRLAGENEAAGAAVATVLADE